MKRTVWATFDGGHLGPSSFEDATRYDSISKLETAFWHASQSCDDGYPDQATVWYYDPNGPEVRGDPYPTEIWSFGPRGGLKREIA